MTIAFFPGIEEPGCRCWSRMHGCECEPNDPYCACIHNDCVCVDPRRVE